MLLLCLKWLKEQFSTLELHFLGMEAFGLGLGVLRPPLRLSCGVPQALILGPTHVSSWFYKMEMLSMQMIPGLNECRQLQTNRQTTWLWIRPATEVKPFHSCQDHEIFFKHNVCLDNCHPLHCDIRRASCFCLHLVQRAAATNDWALISPSTSSIYDLIHIYIYRFAALACYPCFNLSVTPLAIVLCISPVCPVCI